MLHFGDILGEPSAGFGWSSSSSPAANKQGADELLPPRHPAHPRALGWRGAAVGWDLDQTLPSVRSRCDCFNGLFELDLNKHLRAGGEALAQPLPQKAADGSVLMAVSPLPAAVPVPASAPHAFGDERLRQEGADPAQQRVRRLRPRPPGHLRQHRLLALPGGRHRPAPKPVGGNQTVAALGALEGLLSGRYGFPPQKHPLRGDVWGTPASDQGKGLGKIGFLEAVPISASELGHELSHATAPCPGSAVRWVNVPLHTGFG